MGTIALPILCVARREGRNVYARQIIRRVFSAASLAWDHLSSNPAWLQELIRRRRDGSRRVIVVGSSHRVGSTWLFRLLQDLGWLRNGIGDAPAALHRYGALWPGAIDYRWLADIDGWAILKGHADPPRSAKEAALAHFVTIHRDPRDVLVSAGFQRARLPVAQGGWGSDFARLSPTQRIEALLQDPNPTLLYELERWYRTPFALQVRYETLSAQPVLTLCALAQNLSLPVNEKEVEAVVRRNDFARKTGRTPGQAAASAARKGIVGDWRNYFTDRTTFCFKTAMDGRWYTLLQEMGYEW